MHNPLPDLIFQKGGLSDGLFYRALWLTSVTFVVVILILFAFIILYRARPGHKAVYDHGNSRKQLGLTVALSIAVFIGIDLHLAWYDHHAYAVMFDEMPADALPIRVMAKQFEWNFRYPGKNGKFESANPERVKGANEGKPDDFCTIKQLVVQEGTSVQVHMQSIDVIHSLFIPNVRKKQDVVPGLETSLWFSIDPGTSTTAARAAKGDPKFNYEIACAELCGLGHTEMNAILIVKTADEYKAWVEEKTKELDEIDNPTIWEKWYDPKEQEEIQKTKEPAAGEHHE